MPGRTVTEVQHRQMLTTLEKAHGFTAGQKVAEVVGSVISTVQLPAQQFTEVIKASLHIPAMQIQKVLQKAADAIKGDK